MRSAWLATLLAAICVGTAAAQSGPYKVVDHWKLGGTGGWDYLVADGENDLLYVTHGTRVEVVNTRTGKSAGAITGLKGVHGVSLDPDGEVGYISDGAGNAIAVFDRKTYALLDSVPAGTNPDGIAFEPVTRTVWAFNGGSKDVTVMDTRTRAVVATVKLPGKPEFPQADGHGSVFVNIEDTNKIVRLDANGKRVVDTWSMDGCESPSGLAYDEGHKRLFAVCDGKKMVVLDAKTGKILGTPAIGDGPDAVVYTAKGELALSSNGDGTLSVIDARPGKGYAPVETLPTQKGARTMAYQAKQDRVFLAVAELGAPPAATPDNPHPRPSVVPDSFTVIVVGRK